MPKVHTQFEAFWRIHNGHVLILIVILTSEKLIPFLDTHMPIKKTPVFSLTGNNGNLRAVNKQT